MNKDLEAKQNQIKQEMYKYNHASKEYTDLSSCLVSLTGQFYSIINDINEQMEDAHFSTLGGKAENIIADAKRRAKAMLEAIYDTKNNIVDLDLTGEDSFLQGLYEPIECKVSVEEALKFIYTDLSRHFSVLKNDEESTKLLQDYITDLVANSELVEHNGQGKNETCKNGLDSMQLEIRKPLSELKKFSFMNDKINKNPLYIPAQLSKQLTENLTETWGIEQAPAGSKISVPVYLSLEYKGDNKFISKKLTFKDTIVYNTISTIWRNEKLKNPEMNSLIITPQEIWRTMNGVTDFAVKVPQKKIKEIEESIEKMRFTRCVMDISKELNKGWYTIDDSRVVNGSIDTYLLKCDKVTFRTEKSRKLSGYKIENEPILYSYNKAKEHALSFDFDLLNTRETLSNVENKTEFQHYLLQEIVNIKNGKRNPKIKYNTIYEKTEILPPEERIDKSKYANKKSYQSAVRREFRNDRKKIKTILDVVVNEKEIKGYTELEDGTSYEGIMIILNEEDVKEIEKSKHVRKRRKASKSKK